MVIHILIESSQRSRMFKSYLKRGFPLRRKMTPEKNSICIYEKSYLENRDID